MATAVPRRPVAELAPLIAGYRRAVAARRRRTATVILVIIAASVLAGAVGEVDPRTLVANLHRLPGYLRDITPVLTFANLRADLADWYWNLGHWLNLLADTLLIAYLASLAGAIGGFVLCFAASANLTRSRILRFAARRFLELCRTVPDIVFALIFVVAFGLGAMPGVMAIAIHSTGALGKLFAEAVENIDMRPVEGVTAAGGSWATVVRFAVVPQVLPNFASYALLRFEINARSATVIGFVGAGGIGQDLLEAIRKFYYSDVSAILLLIIGMVMIIDITTERIRHALIGRDPRR
ncbi:MAG: phosphonate ABC transporter, permease protein PhnE [Xanthobacteraceae bacterium]